MTSKLLPIANLDLGDLELIIFLGHSQDFFKEAFCEFRLDILACSGDGPQGLEDRVVELGHAGGLLQVFPFSLCP